MICLTHSKMSNKTVVKFVHVNTAVCFLFLVSTNQLVDATIVILVPDWITRIECPVAGNENPIKNVAR